MAELFWIAVAGFVTQIAAITLQAYFAHLAARRLSAELARNTKITRETKDIMQGQRPFLVRDYSPSGGD